jgi:hypothetical protein
LLGVPRVRPLLLAASLAAGCTAPATGPSGDGPGGGAAGAPDGGSADAGGELEPGDAFLGGFFPIAADFQPHRDFEKWQRRGVNTVVRVPGEDSVGDWSRAARDLGLKMIREPRSDPADDRDEEGLLAWHWRDEPELHGVPASELADFRRRMRDVDPDRPIIVNFWGGGMLQADDDGCYDGHCYPDYVEHADWLSDDIYPCNKFACDVELVGEMVSQLRRWGDHQPAFAYVETGDFDGDGTGPSPRRFAAEVWSAVIHGARGIFYFSARVKVPCDSGCLLGYDMTEPDVADEMKRVDERLTRLASILQRGINPDQVAMDGPDGLEIGWRRDPVGQSFYFFVLNPEDAHRDAVSLDLHGVHPSGPVQVVDEGREVEVAAGNAIVDDFDPYEIHIYQLPAA